MKRLSLSISSALLCVLALGCNSFERTTYQTLAAAQSVVNVAQQDYKAGKLPQNKCVYALINSATAADALAVNAMVVYEQEKASGGSLAAQQDIVAGELADLGPIIVQVQSLYTANTSTCKGGN